MKLTSKYDEGATVWFLNNMGGMDTPAKFLEGEVTAVQGWDKWSGFRYDVTHINLQGAQMSYNVQEKDMYKSKNDVIANAFEENGTLPSPEEPVVEEGAEQPAA